MSRESAFTTAAGTGGSPHPGGFSELGTTWTSAVTGASLLHAPILERDPGHEPELLSGRDRLAFDGERIHRETRIHGDRRPSSILPWSAHTAARIRRRAAILDLVSGSAREARQGWRKMEQIPYCPDALFPQCRDSGSAALGKARSKIKTVGLFKAADSDRNEKSSVRYAPEAHWTFVRTVSPQAFGYICSNCKSSIVELTSVAIICCEPGWRNWQTQRTQNPPVLSTLGVQLPLPAD